MFLANRIFKGIATSKHLEWYPKSGGAFIKFYIESYSLKTLFFVHQQTQFKHLMMGFNLNENIFNFPAGVNLESKVLDFLMETSSPKAVQMTFGNRKRFLRNLACQKDIVKAIHAIQNPSSIYSHLSAYLKKQGNIENTPSINYFLVQFYLRLSAQKYCKVHNIPLSTPLTDKMKQQILNSIENEYDNNSPKDIQNLKSQVFRVETNLAETDRKIQNLKNSGEKKLYWYKYGAIAVTAAHILSFGYMIFMVDWLGWDIIEPLTYTVGVFYTLLGIRFYRKFKIDRTTQTVKEALLRILMKPGEKVLLKDLQGRKEIQQRQITKLKNQILILQNKINFRSSLCTSFK